MSEERSDEFPRLPYFLRSAGKKPCWVDFFAYFLVRTRKYVARRGESRYRIHRGTVFNTTDRKQIAHKIRIECTSASQTNKTLVINKQQKISKLK